MTPLFERWPTDGRALVEQAVTAHGGAAAWQSVRSVKLGFGAASGVLARFKGYPTAFGAPREFEVRPHEQQTIFHAYPDARHRGWFLNGDVMIEDVATRQPVAQSRDHRRTFTGPEKRRQWNPLDALYFFGYALWHYHVLPFTLGDARFIRLVGDAGIEVEFAASVHTHCRRQCFFFDAEGRIARHDYVANVLGIWARGCHFWQSYREVNGLQIAHERRVSARAFGRPVPLTALSVSLASR